jgi:hypothetical protein
MRERVLLFCLLGLVLTATILLVIAPGAVTWALALIEGAAADTNPMAFVSCRSGQALSSEGACPRHKGGNPAKRCW